MKNSARVFGTILFLLVLAGSAAAQPPGYSSRDELGLGGGGAGTERELRIALAWGEQLRPPEDYSRAIVNLRDAMAKWTSVPTAVERRFRIGSSSLSDVHVLFILTDQQFQLSETEKKNLKEFIRAGGLIVADDAGAGTANAQARGSLRRMIRDIAGGGRLEPVPPSHEIYTTPFLIGGPPQGSDNAMVKTGERVADDGTVVDVMVWPDEAKTLEGVSVDGRLVILYSEKGYTQKWNDAANDSQLRFGVNLMMYAAGNR